MEPIELLYVICSVAVITSGLVMAGMAVRAYAVTQRRAMIFLSVGFTLIVAAASATTISAFVSDFQNPRTLLTVNYFVTSLGFVAVIVSLYVE
ncbi:hypothetical protein AB7C87_21140 [Natrarchaeobius sp. A-rgal3]|uniref:DUF7521 family protein n=1 Tax=Natrarchaeobius versutus TaxID=1679078 RepID=UPI00350FF6D7